MGNSKYSAKSGIPALKNPRNDAKDLAHILKNSCRFETVVQLDVASRDDMERIADDFGEMIKESANSGHSPIAFFFYGEKMCARCEKIGFFFPV